MFECRRCGDCCRSGWGIPPGAGWFKQWVVISKEDIERISEHLNISPDEMRSLYGIKENQLDITGGKCPFLDNNGCSIHEIKPQFCADKNPCEEKMASKKGIHFDKITAQRTSGAKASVVVEEIARVKVPCISDAITHREVGGQQVLMALDNGKVEGMQDPMTGVHSGDAIKWKLRKIKNTDGSDPKPGQEVLVKFMRKDRDDAGHKLSAMDFEAMKKRGGLGPDRFHRYVLDQDCCIECGYADAMYLLTEYGVHYENGIALNSKKQTTKKGAHNWQWVEVVDGVNDSRKSAK